MNINGRKYHTIWVHPENDAIIQIIDQTLLPFDFQIKDLASEKDAFNAIRNMTVRGAPLIGVTGAYGVYLALLNCNDNSAVIPEEIKTKPFCKIECKEVCPTIVFLSYIKIYQGVISLIDEITRTR